MPETVPHEQSFDDLIRDEGKRLGRPFESGGCDACRHQELGLESPMQVALDEFGHRSLFVWCRFQSGGPPLLLSYL